MNKAEILIRREILKQAIERGDLAYEGDIPDECVDEVYSSLQETDSHWDYESEFRGGTHETDIPAECSRHYESKSVARLIGDQWVGWTYWYGGGKHGEPESIEWIRDAYLLNCKETEKLVVCREWTKLEPNQ